MDNIDKQYDIKRFLKNLYRDIDLSEEHIRIFQNNKEGYNKVSYFNDIDELVSFCSHKYNYSTNTYFELATTDGEGGTTKNLKYRYCLGFDFDKKDLGADFNHKDIITRFNELKIYCHCLIDSGNGYHAYVFINRTNDLKKVDEVQKVLGEKLGADKNAIKSTQILRVPGTFNVKDKSKLVKIITPHERYDRNNINFKAYDIEFLYKKNCQVQKQIDNKITEYMINNTNIPKCINNILTHGSQEGYRYKNLQNIVVALRQRNKTLGEIKAICKEWGLKSNYDDNLEYRVEHIYNNKDNLELSCNKCIHRVECYNKVVSDFEFEEGYSILTFTETTQKYLKKSNRKGVKSMKPNDLLVFGVLSNNKDGLYKDEILQELTYTKKKVVKNVAMSIRTLGATLKSLEDNGFIEVDIKDKNKKLYKVKEVNSKIDLTYKISYAAMFECVKGNISTEELRLYCYMRYLHHKQQREVPGALKGNLFQINQMDLAKELDLTQGRISMMINNLLDEKLLGIWYRQKSKNNGFEYNIYRLNY